MILSSQCDQAMSVSVSSLSGPGDGSMASVTTLPGAGSLSASLAGNYRVSIKLSNCTGCP